jgi:hypothetical protein
MRTTVLALSVAFSVLGASGESRAQSDFMTECRVTASEKTCNCMQAQVPAAQQLAAIAAMRKSNAAMNQGSTPLDPSTLPPAEMQGLQAVVLAQAACM